MKFRPRDISRRRTLLGTLSCAPLACRTHSDGDDRGARGGASGGASAGRGPADWGGLDMARVGSMGEDEPGGVAVVLLHGWGAEGDDLVNLARELARPHARFFIPAAPLSEAGGGRAWWHLNLDDRPAHAWDDHADADYQPNQQLAAVRTAVQTILKTIRERYAPDAL